MKRLDLVEPLSRPDEKGMNRVKNRLRGKPAEDVRSFFGNGSSWVDYFVVSRKLDERGLVQATAIIPDSINGSDHSMVGIDIDLESALGKSSVWKDIEAAMRASKVSNMNAIFRTIKLSDHKRVRGYQEELRKRVPRRGHLVRSVELLYDTAIAKGPLGVTEEERQVLIEAADKAMSQVTEAMVVAEKKLYQTLPKAGGSHKHVMTDEYEALATDYRVSRRLVATFNKPSVSRPARDHLATLVKRAHSAGAKLPKFSHARAVPNNLEKHTDWKHFIGRVQGGLKEKRGMLHCASRKQMKDWRSDRTVRLTDWLDSGQLGKCFDNVLGRVKDGAVDSAHVTEYRLVCTCDREEHSADEDGRAREECRCTQKVRVRRAAASGEEVKQSQLEYMTDWMGANKVMWFHFESGVIPGDGKRRDGDAGHLIARLDAEGFAFRCRIAEGRITEQEMQTIPEQFRVIIPHLQRKMLKQLGRRIEPSDYDKVGLMEEISVDVWRSLWSGCKAGTRGGASGLHVNMMKAMMKTVTMKDGKPVEKRSEGSNQECITEHVSETLRKLVSVARILRAHLEQWTHELLYTFIKVPGGVGLEDSRPVGLLEILMKGSKSVDYSGIANTWERVQFLHGSQNAFRQGRGTEGLLML
jgi:hypothetical protein